MKKKKTDRDFWLNLPDEYLDGFLELEHCTQEVMELESLLDDVYKHMVKLAKKRDMRCIWKARETHERVLEVLEKVTFNEDVLYAIIHYVDDLEDGIAFHKQEAADVQAALDDIIEILENPNPRLKEKLDFVYKFIEGYANKQTYRYIKQERGADSES